MKDDSRSIAAAAYEREEETLRITFKPDATDRQGRTYDYLEVPAEVVDEFLDAESHGQFVNWRIKPNYDCREVAQSASTKIPLEILKDMNGQDKHGHDR